ncbi:hypothetical protein C3489_10585 [Streptomyces sp. Ru71]|uniref:hypothetical protein n=1 Tax=Streptomyces sp. Ru71 TaxID=2080746 RepID=UPI000CDE4FE4|nr:hypothetical protein [Streptomyces sp. Ru71]POX55515.1 hypothetical protein C3489_10585 [Streptomyces sp. Ru71]
MPDKPSDDETAHVPDDVWEKFVRDTELDIRATAPKEPSAAARGASGVPEGWRTGPAWREPDGRAARRRRLWALLGIPVAVAVAVVAMKPSLLPGDPFRTGSAQAATAPPLPPETARPTAPESAAPDHPTLDRPFAGSPAERWADGETGIVPPPARAVGVHSKAEVAKALEQTRTLLVDANLDPATLRGERPAEALSVIEPHETELRTRLDASLRRPDKEHDPLLMFTRFRPGDVRLVGTVVKTRGRMTLAPGEHGSARIHADYTFVYPLVRTDGSTEVTRTVVRRVLDIDLYDPDRYRVTPGRIAVTDYDQEVGNSACGIHDGFLHPQFDSAAPTGAPPTGAATDPYDRSKDLDPDRSRDCGTVSRI